MKKKYRNEEARNAIAADMGDTLMFYLYEYREEADKWGEAFKTEFNNIVDSIIEGMKEED